MKSSNYNHVIPQKKINLNMIQLPHLEISSLPHISSPSQAHQSCPKQDTCSSLQKNTFYFDSSTSSQETTNFNNKLNDSVQSSSVEKISFSTRRNFSANQNKHNNSNKILKINGAFPSDFFSPVKTIHLKLNSNSNNTNMNGVSGSISTKESMGSLVNSSHAKNSQENDNEKLDIEGIENIDESIATKNSELDVTATFGKFMFQDFQERAKTPAFNLEASKLLQEQTQSHQQQNSLLNTNQFQLKTNSSKKKFNYPQSAKQPQNQDEKLCQIQQKSNKEYQQMIKPSTSKNIFSKNQQPSLQNQNLTVSGRIKLSKVLSYNKIDPIGSTNLQYLAQQHSTCHLPSFNQKNLQKKVNSMAPQQNMNQQQQQYQQQQQQIKFKVKIPQIQAALKTISSNDILNENEVTFPKSITSHKQQQFEKNNQIYKEDDLELLQQQQQQQQSDISQILKQTNNDISETNLNNNKNHYYMGTIKRKIISTTKNQQKSLCINNTNIINSQQQKQNNNTNNLQEKSYILNSNVTVSDLKSVLPKQENVSQLQQLQQKQPQQTQLKSQQHIFTKKQNQQQQITNNTQLLRTNLNLNKLVLGKQQSQK